MQWYLQAKSGMELPPDVEPPEELPDALCWLLQVERWGFPVSGGFLEQPWHFMQDLEAALLGRARVDEIKEANVRLQREYANGHQDRTDIPHS